ncbi:MAG TPA: hypothetical protein VHX37_13295 [Acidobacteriaceae bacterium]|jgi:hypothetical protein|nr:hypothetical protein [Acidobacteriaceae bacterium]
MKTILKLCALAALVPGGFVMAQHEKGIDFTQQLTTLAGTPLPSSPEKGASALTLGDVCVNALETPLEADRGVSGEAKFKLDSLARKIYGKKDVLLTVDESALLKQRIGQAYGPLVVGQAWRMLDPAEK